MSDYLGLTGVRVEFFALYDQGAGKGQTATTWVVRAHFAMIETDPASEQELKTLVEAHCAQLGADMDGELGRLATGERVAIWIAKRKWPATLARLTMVEVERPLLGLLARVWHRGAMG